MSMKNHPLLHKFSDKLDNNGCALTNFTIFLYLLEIITIILNKYRENADRPNLLVSLSTLLRF